MIFHQSSQFFASESRSRMRRRAGSSLQRSTSQDSYEHGDPNSQCPDHSNTTPLTRMAAPSSLTPATDFRHATNKPRQPEGAHARDWHCSHAMETRCKTGDGSEDSIPRGPITVTATFHAQQTRGPTSMRLPVTWPHKGREPTQGEARCKNQAWRYLHQDHKRIQKEKEICCILLEPLSMM